MCRSLMLSQDCGLRGGTPLGFEKRQVIMEYTNPQGGCLAGATIYARLYEVKLICLKTNHCFILSPTHL